MTDPMTRIADALELMALMTWLDSPTNYGVCDALFESIVEARHAAAQQTPVAAEAGHPASAESALRDRVAPSGGDSGHLSAPPDDDPEWRDVPAELMRSHSIFRGDRYWSDIGRAWRIAPFTFSVSVIDSLHWIKRHDHFTRKPAPQTVDVKAHELRAGDVILAMVYSAGDTRDGNWRVVNPDEWGAACMYRVRLPRPDAEPSADASEPTRVGVAVTRRTDDAGTISFDASGFTTVRLCRHCGALIAGGPTACAHCTRIYPGDVEPAAEPSACGEGIARLRHTLLEIGAHSWAVGELHDQPWLMASRIVGAINAAHVHATRELRARCERAERERDEARAEFNGAANERDRAKLERIAAIARAEAAERVVEAAVDVVAAWRMPGTPLTTMYVALSNALDAARKDGAK